MTNPSESTGSIENFKNLSTVEVGLADSSRPNAKEPSLPMIGFHLSRLVLGIISAFILLLVIILFVKQFDASPDIKIPVQTNVPDSTYIQKLEFIKLVQQEKKEYRDFILQIAQMILLNLLLPVLTAILGYIFASNKNKE